MAKKIVLNDVFKKYLKVVGYLLLSGVLGWVLATYVANDPAATAIFAPAINFVIYIIKQELDKEGVYKAIRG